MTAVKTSPHDVPRAALHRRPSVTLGLALMLAAALLAMALPASARRKKGDAPLPHAEVPVSVRVAGVGQVELPALILEERGELYLPVAYLFEYLKIRHTVTVTGDSIVGGMGSALPEFVVDAKQGIVWRGKQPIRLTPDDYVQNDIGIYLRAAAFDPAFDLVCAFNFRMLSVDITSRQELPAMREARLAANRAQAGGKTGVIQPDTVLARVRPMFSFGSADWLVMATRRLDGNVQLRGQLSLGLTALGGETVLGLTAAHDGPLDPRRQYYLWRWVDNERRGVRQVALGKVFTPITSSIFSPLIGVQVTNTPTTQRTSFSTYRYTGTTKPGWTVELYINNALTDYVKADTAGYYAFEIPLSYGASAVKLRFYGPYGEESFREENIVIPFNFLPEGQLEYTASAGIVEDTMLWRGGRRGLDTAFTGETSYPRGPDKFARLAAAYGVSRSLTAMGGVEYLSSVTSGPVMPFVGGSARLSSRILVSGDYAFGARAKANLTYRLPKGTMLELGYWRYDKGQTAILTNYRERRNVTLTVPVTGKRFTVFNRASYNDLVLPSTRVRTAEWNLTGHVGHFNTNISTFASMIQESEPLVYTSAAVTVRCPKGYLLTPQLQYDYLANEWMSAKVLLEKNIFRSAGFVNLGYEKNFRSNVQAVTFGVRYDFSFAQIAYNGAYGLPNGGDQLMARGGVHYDSRGRKASFTNRTAVGRAGLVVTAFLDLNCNGRRDEGEPRVPGFKFRGSGGRMEDDARDTVIRVYDLEPYTRYLIYPDAGSFDNIAWQVKQKAIAVEVAPNILTEVAVPVAVVGEVSGLVYTSDAKGKRKGRGRIMVVLQDEAGQTLARTMTESDGYFSFMSLSPGTYYAAVEIAQLSKLKMTATPTRQEIRILPKMDGDMVSGVNFCLRVAEEVGKGAECP